MKVIQACYEHYHRIFLSVLLVCVNKMKSYPSVYRNVIHNAIMKIAKVSTRWNITQQ